MVGQQRIADAGDHVAVRGAAVLHRHEFMEIATVKSPGVDDLLTVGVDDFDCLTLAHERGLAAAGRDGDRV